MALPSGYTQLEYIQSSGTQYIDTGFKPNQDTRCVMDIENLSTAQAVFMGARASASAASFTFFSLTATTGRSDYNTKKQSMTFSSTLGRYTVDKNKNVCIVNSVTATNATSTFQLTNNLYLLAVNTANAASNYAKVKLYSCKIYDNGTLVRDFIPCKNASATVGLWDDVNSVFYTNAGTGTFTAGEMPKGTHRTLIAGTGYDIKSGRVLIAGTGYGIKKGRTLIGGTGYDISFGIPVGDLAVGTSVYMNVNGVRKEWFVAHQGKPSSLYDDTCYGTWLMLKDIYTKVTRDKSPTGYFGTAIWGIMSDPCAHDIYLTDTFFPLLDTEIQNLIKMVNIPDIDAASDYSVTYPRKIFLASWAELGNVSSTPLKYFEANTNAKRIAYYDNEYGYRQAWYWALRNNIYTSDGTAFLRQVDTDGSKITTTEFTSGIRPLVILPQEDAKIDDSFNITP